MLSFQHGIWKHKNLATWGAEKLCVLIESPGKKKRILPCIQLPDRFTDITAATHT